jgi:hypothetical protein
VAEAISRALELDRDVVLPRGRVVEAALGEELVHALLSDDLGQELVNDDPLVVVGHNLPRLREDSVGAAARVPRANQVDYAVVELEERGLQAADDDVLIVARVTDDRSSVRVVRVVGIVGAGRRVGDQLDRPRPNGFLASSLPPNWLISVSASTTR